MDFIAKPDLGARTPAAQGVGYAGTPIVVLQPTDRPPGRRDFRWWRRNSLRRPGFKVDMQSMDWQTLVSRRAQGRLEHLPDSIRGRRSWLNPLSNIPLSGGCDKAWFGWPCDAELERLRDDFARATTSAQRKALAEQVQVRAMEVGTACAAG